MIKKILKYFAITIFSAGFIWTFYFLYKKSQKKPQKFEVTSPQYMDIVKKTIATGSIVPRREVDITPKVSGIIQNIYFEAGEKVKSGDIIANVKIVPNMTALNNAENRVNTAKINLDNSETLFQRNEKLYGEAVISEREFLDIKSTYLTAKENLIAAENNLQLVKDGILKRSGKESNTLVKATISGMILDIPVEQGNSVIESNTFNDGTVIATIADMREMIFDGNVDESEVGKIREGMPLVVKIGAISDEELKAKLEYISPKGKDQAGTIQFQIKAAMELKEGIFLRAGYSANADIIMDKKDSVYAIEESLVQFDEDNKSFVEVLENEEEHTFNKKYVELGISDGIHIELLTSLGDSVKIKKWNKYLN